jgi:dihydrodipicolinate synthase/N-acetylneuraminate lyase
MTAPAILNYFRSIADRSPLPVILYNIPKCVPLQIPIEVIGELANHPNIIGIKDSSGSVERIQGSVAATKNAPRRTVQVTEIFEAVTARMMSGRPGGSGSFVAADELAGGAAVATAPPAVPLKTRTKEVGFQVLCGAGGAVLESLKSGATGAILAFGACTPQACQEIYLAWKDHDVALATEKQQRIAAANKRIVGDFGIAGIKYACDFNGFFGGRTRNPILGLTADEKAEVEGLLEETRN